MLTLGDNYFQFTNQNLIILVSLDCSSSYLFIDIQIERFGFHLTSQFDNFLSDVHFGDFLIFDFQ